MGKDEGWYSYFQDNHRYADVINGIGCEGEQFVKADDLEEADTTEKKKSRDLLRKVAFGVNYAIIGIENQEKMDYELPLRNMQYDASRYQKQATAIGKEVRANKKGLLPGEYMYGFKKDSKLNPIVTFALYTGEEKWDGATSLHDILDFTNMPESLKNMVSDYKINVIDIRQMENTDVFQTDVKQVFDFIRCSENKEKLFRLVESDEYYQHMEKDAFDVVTKYTNSKDLVNMEEYELEGGKRNVCKAIRDLMADSKEEGREEGIRSSVNMLRKLGKNDDEILELIMEEYKLEKEKVLEYLS